MAKSDTSPTPASQPLHKGRGRPVGSSLKDNPGPDWQAGYLRNLQAMADWYRSLPSGVEVGHNVGAEIAVRNNATALQLALEGKNWTPPL